MRFTPTLIAFGFITSTVVMAAPTPESLLVAREPIAKADVVEVEKKNLDMYLACYNEYELVPAKRSETVPMKRSELLEWLEKRGC
ncbi:hypothetical protein EJ08DRAFT_654048 [Tothia fuscella]|uniref:Uncharacterized protein n=1 Tax=Tothia fuscella TaxID=1048955 RepID=A0A9P4NFJ6_9PEZI|nr:hypothetical protein EJ08DRAFT_654048 [Tothia fuscella]